MFVKREVNLKNEHKKQMTTMPPPPPPAVTCPPRPTHTHTHHILSITSQAITQERSNTIYIHYYLLLIFKDLKKVIVSK
jgi:hypothetical protein